ncbi:mutS protein homolog 5-like [Ornithodoros turicata]|uniref:mutS protein homolog 5-like n=1 Tax=Ornithodoros turicata TaxID=34597 RepID=UPI0031392CCB
MHSLLFLVLNDVKPTVIVVSASVDEALTDSIAEFLAPCEEGASSVQDFKREVVHVLPNKDFSYEAGRHRLLYLRLPEVPKNLSEETRFVYMSSLVDLNAISMVRAAGGLLNFLDKWNRSRLHNIDEDDAIVKRITARSLSDRVWICQTTFSSLQIFKQEWHPSVYKFGVAGKEGLSLFGIFNHCKSKVGERELRNIFCRPTTDQQVLVSRHDAIAYFLAPRNQPVIETLQECLVNIKDVFHILTNMTKGATSAAEWKTLHKTAESVLAIHGICQSKSPQATETGVIWKIRALPAEDIARVAVLISSIVDFEASEVEQRFAVRHGIDEELDEKMRIYNGLPDLLTKVAYEEADRVGLETDCQVVYIPQIGYLVNFPTDDMVGLHLPDLQFLFESDGKMFYKSPTTRGLDAMLGDTLCEIMDRETEIMQSLQGRVLEIAGLLVEAVSVCGELDALLSLVLTAKEHNYVRPAITSEPIICIENGRHPLVENASTNFIPNSYVSGGRCSKVKVITGPNSCGKSIYLKQVALVVYLAHIGSYVPAKAACVGPVDAILSCIHVEESILLGLSSFAIQLNQMAHVFQEKGANSLVVVDEFGKGTRASRGAGLLIGTIGKFLSEPQSCPHALFSTHFNMLQDHLPVSPLLSYQTFETVKYNDDLVYLYKLKDGIAESSCASVVGRLASLRSDVIRRQLEVLENMRSRSAFLRRNQTTRANISESCKRDTLEMLTEMEDFTEASCTTFVQNVRAALLINSPANE